MIFEVDKNWAHERRQEYRQWLFDSYDKTPLTLPTDKEKLENLQSYPLFKPTKKLLRQVIKELKIKCYEIIKENNKSEWAKIFNKPCHETLIKRIREYEWYLKTGGKETATGITSSDIARAREYPIHLLYEGKFRKSGGNYIGICPFHQEKTGSFVVGRRNRFKCFGCGEFGDSIDFIIKTKNLSFIEAVKYLCKKI